MPKQPEPADKPKRITLVFSPDLYNAVRESAQADRRAIGAQAITLIERGLQARRTK